MTTMWFVGEIGQAIARIKQENKILLVFVYGEIDDDSKQVSTYFEQSSMSEICTDFVCLRLEITSIGAKQFVEYYPVKIIPSIFLINSNGAPLQVILGRVTEDTLKSKLIEVTAASKMPKSNTSSSQYGVSQSEAQQCSAASSSTSDVTSSSPSVTPCSEHNTASASFTSELNDEHNEFNVGQLPGESKEEMSARLERLRDRIEAKRLENLEKERKKEIEAEKERRQQGKSLGKFSDFKREQQQKELREELANRKKDETAARDRVKKQIEEDRKERAKKYASDKEAIISERQDKEQSKMQQVEEASRLDQEARMKRIRIQFRLPSGSSVTEEFASTDLLSVAREFIVKRIKEQYKIRKVQEVSLSTLYPRRTFTEADMSQLMLDLNLGLSVAIVVTISNASAVKPDASSRSKNKTVATSSESSRGVFQGFMLYLLWLWGLVVAFFQALLPIPRLSNSQQPAHGSSTAQHRGPTVSQGPSTSSSDGSMYGRVPGPTHTVHRRGNIGQLKSDDSDKEDKDRKTYNGNSTQQL